ncbi:hypothetical protein LTR78_006082 [Recurvomyces mirabilis]|uniref:glucan 1,3-beta-glucosidase n=1 Tax=Recurvomyces mirabilis TaxID=574656 RepID=A0AAE0WLG3_9PEZI|nr:hypothetical protein LTR78_006082 [Recurvomyces mirabilis]KAK5151924.1 hypothetical protein LTS14_008698 [Recurvomyces mirabilis]
MPTASKSPRDSSARRQRKRRTHQRVDSNGDFAPRSRDERRYEREEGSSSPTKSQPRRTDDDRPRSTLSAGQLAQLDKLNQKLGWDEPNEVTPPRRPEPPRIRRRDDEADRELEDRERRRQEHKERKRRRRGEEEERATAADAGVDETESLVYDRRKVRREEKGRIVSGQRLERGSQAYYDEKEGVRDGVRLRGGAGSSSDYEYEEAQRKKKRRKRIIIAVAVVVLILAIAIPVGVVVSQNKGPGSSSSGSNSTTSSQPANSNLKGMSENDIPKQYQGTYLDPFTWYDTSDFNVTFTDVMVGGLSVMGLNDTWDDSKKANPSVPALNEKWTYGTQQVHGVNVGGWLSIEPYMTPSLFSGYNSKANVIDEYTLTQTLGASKAKSILEQHYATFITEQDFAAIQAAGFDHVRIPFSYWAVTTYDGDPYVANVSWRYLLRGIEWARKYGLRINLDLHGAPGSQNGWNHSGRQGAIGWLNGTDGTTNGDRTIAIHDQLSQFFTQPRYKNIIAMYGLVNEPRMVELDTSTVLTWTTNAVNTIRKNKYNGTIVFGDGFMGLDNWQGKLQDLPNLLLDVHQYVIFNVQQITLNHHDKIQFACDGWTQQALRSMNTATGFGPTLCGEWSQADTDCAQYLNNVGVGSRWEGTLNMIDTPGGGQNGSVLSPTCPTHNNPQCSCQDANAAPSSYSAEYKTWLLMFAEAQMHSFEQGWGWFYWTWKTEAATQWSYSNGIKAGIVPGNVRNRTFDCSQSIPDFGGLGLPEFY